MDFSVPGHSVFKKLSMEKMDDANQKDDEKNSAKA